MRSPLVPFYHDWSLLNEVLLVFKEHTLANPVLATASFTSAAGSTTVGSTPGAVGRCLTDSFTIVNNGGPSRYGHHSC